nr:MAG TPA: hypothetical protein [Caudoviricetes sp.]
MIEAIISTPPTNTPRTVEITTPTTLIISPRTTDNLSQTSFTVSHKSERDGLRVFSHSSLILSTNGFKCSSHNSFNTLIILSIVGLRVLFHKS